MDYFPLFGGPLIDRFHQLHHPLVFSDRNQIRITDDAFSVAIRVARAGLDPPSIPSVDPRRPSEVHKLHYELFLEEKLYEYRLNKACDRMLVEIVLLHHLLKILTPKAEQDKSNNRPLSVIGWMIQDRLAHILLQSGSRSLDEIHALANTFGIDRNAWESRLAGAAAEVHAMQQLTQVHDLRVYPATLYEDTSMRIDFFLELAGSSTGACVSVKTQVNGQTRFMTESLPGYEEWWQSIHDGAREFTRIARRHWLPILITVGKPQGQDIVLTIPSRADSWAFDLQEILHADNQRLLRTA